MSKKHQIIFCCFHILYLLNIMHIQILSKSTHSSLLINYNSYNLRNIKVLLYKTLWCIVWLNTDISRTNSMLFYSHLFLNHTFRIQNKS